MASPRHRAMRASAAVLIALAAVDRANAGPTRLDDPEIRAAEEALEAGTAERAAAILELAAPRSDAECQDLRARLDGDDVRVVRACDAATRAWMVVGLARQHQGDDARAHQAFTRAIAIEPEALPPASLTPPKARRVFVAARQAALGRDLGSEPGSIPYLDHRPPLIAVHGQAVPLDLAPSGPWLESGTVEIVYAIDGLERGTLRLPTHRHGQLISGELPAGAILDAHAIHYRFDAVDASGRVLHGRWYPIHLVDSLTEAGARKILSQLADEIDGTAFEAVSRLGVTLEVSAPLPLPDGVTAVADRPESPDRNLAADVAAAVFR